MRRMGSIGRKICQRIKFADENGVIILGAGILIQVHLHAADERDGIRQGFQQPFHLVQVFRLCSALRRFFKFPHDDVTNHV